MTEADYNDLLDTSGLRCPEPVMMLHRQIRKMAVGNVVCVIATDPAAERDIPQFCEFLNHTLVKHSGHEGEYRFWVRKAGR